MLMIFDPVIPYLHIYLKEMISMNKKETDTKIFFAVCVCVRPQLCLTLCNPM